MADQALGPMLRGVEKQEIPFIIIVSTWPRSQAIVAELPEWLQALSFG
jgi:hypothetical protein